METLTRADAAWLHMDEARNHFVVTTLLVLGRPLDLRRLRAALAARLLAQPRFSERIEHPWLPGLAPRWVEDPNFDLDSHVHRAVLAPPAGPAQLAELIGDLAGRPIDLQRPPWECHLVESYGAGAALITRIHHAVGDGASLLEMLLELTDVRSGHRFEPAVSARPSSPRRSAVPAALDLAGKVLADPAGAVLEAVRFAGTVAKITLGDPDPPSALKGPLGVRKAVAWSRPYRLSEIGRFADGSGVKVNDVLMSAIAGALGEHLGDELPGGPIHAMVPVNLRPGGGPAGPGNQFSLVMAELPLGVRHPHERLMRMKLEMDRIKASMEPLAGWVLIAGLGSVPAPVEQAVSAFYAAKASLVLTNVPGPRRRIYLAGVPVASMAFWEPESGSIGIGFSIFSYAGEVVIGLIADAGLVPDPAGLVGGVEGCLDELLSGRPPR